MRGGIGNSFSDKKTKSFILKDAIHRAENNLEARKEEVSRMVWG